MFRVIAIALATFLLNWTILKLLGGAYLIYVAVKHFFFESKDPEKEQIKLDASGIPILVDEDTGRPLTREEEEQEITARTPAPTEVLERFVQVAGACGVLADRVRDRDDRHRVRGRLDPRRDRRRRPPAGGPPATAHPKLWVIIIGGFLGADPHAFAAVMFIKLLDRFPRFETAAYLLVVVIGLKLCIDWDGNKYFASRRIPIRSTSTAPSRGVLAVLGGNACLLRRRVLPYTGRRSWGRPR